MYNLVKKNNMKILVSLISIMVLFVGLTFFMRKGNNSLSERDRRLMQYDQYQDGDQLINGTDYVTFDAYFLEDVNGTATKIRGNYINVNKSAELWIDLHIFGDVTLKDAKLELVNSNVETSGYLYKSSIIKKTAEVPNGGVIELNESISGATLNNKITITSSLTNNITSYSGTNKVILTGTVVKPNGEETAIEKEVDYLVDWYFDDFAYFLSSEYNAKQSFPYTRVIDCPADDARYNYHHEWNGKNYEVTYTLKTYTNSPLLKSANIEAVIPDLNGQHPISVTMKDTNVTYNYDENTQTLTASRQAVLNGTLFTKKAYTYADNNTNTYYNDWEIIIEYPKEVEDDSQTLPLSVDLFYEYYQIGENGAINTVTTNKKNHIYTYDYIKPIIRSTIPVCGNNPDKLEFLFNLSVGSYSYNLRRYYINRTDMTKTYEGVDTANPKTYYSVVWRVYLSYFDRFEDDSITSLVLTDVAADTASGNTLDDISYYKTISVGSLATYLGSSGYIKLYNNETNELLHVFTSLDWSSPYTFEDGVSSIRIETSEFVNKVPMRRHYEQWGWQDDHPLELFNINISKEIDNQRLKNTYDYATYLNMSSVNSRIRLTGTRYRADENREDGINSTSYSGSANLMDKQSAIIEISTDKTTIDSTKIENVNFKIKTGTSGDIVDGYKDAEFIMVLPDWVLDLDINSVTANTGSVNIVGYEKVEVNGHRCVRIITENDQAVSYIINVDADIIPDARKIDRTDNVIIYASNPSTSVSERYAQDTYDVDQDGNTDEYQNYNTSSLKLAAPNEIITTTTINYKDNDDNESTVVSPLIAEVDPVLNQSAAQIEIGLTNNALYPTKDIKVIGKLAYQGNTYQIGDGDLGSEFNVKMTDDGITIPTELVGKAKVYYSDKTEPTDNITDANNNWKTKENVADFNDIKSYLIVIDDYTLQVGDTVKFTYDIEVPNTSSNLNKKTFFTHGVYYNIVAGENMLLPSSVGGAKLGVRISRQYNLNLTDLKASSNRPLANSKYVLTDEDGVQKLLSTDSNGQALAKNLYVDKAYTLKQLSVKSPYILDEEEKTITVVNGANDQLSVSVNGTLKSAELEGTKKLNIVHENEVRYDIILENTDLDTDEPIAFSKFKITGKGYENGVTVTVGSDGKMLLNYLYLDELYEVEQVKADSYSLAKKFNIKLTRDTDGNVKITVKKVAEMGEPVNISTYGYRRRDLATYEPVNGYYEHHAAYFPIDLTEFTDNFTMTFTYQYYGRYSSYDSFMLYLTDNITDLAGLSSVTPFANVWYHASYSSMASTPTTYNAYDPDTGTYTLKPIETNKQYYLYVDYNKRGYSYDGYVYKPTIVNSEGLNYQYLVKSETSGVPTFENMYATQSIQDSDNQDAPVLTVNVKNAKIPSYTLRINKVNAETKEPLAGAQFKVEGPGLPEAGKYITTDANGQATVELYEKLGQYEVDDSIETFNDLIAIRKYDTVYKVTEVTAPIGYTLDDKSVEFQGRYYASTGYSCDYYAYNCDMDLNDPDGSLNIEYKNGSEAQFREFSYDRATNIVDATIYDYPIINIVKKDAETGEVLPNTLFSIFKIENINDVEVLVPATDEKGNIVGTPTTIDGTQQYIVSTDENGKLMFSLSAGKYQLKEVQASSEKYTLVGTTYYFGVGETVPYRAKGVDYVGNVEITNAFENGSDQSSNQYTLTKDGGVILTTQDGHLIKYDKDLNVEWDVEAWVYYTGTVTIAEFEDRNEEVYYAYLADYDENGNWLSTSMEIFDPDDMQTIVAKLQGHGNKYYPTYVVESSDGGYLVSGANLPIIVKYDANGNREWQSDISVYRMKYYYSHVCTYEGNLNDTGDKVLTYRYDKDTNTWVPNREYHDVWNSETSSWEYIYDGDYIYIDKPTSVGYGENMDSLRYIDENTYYCNANIYYDPIDDSNHFQNHFPYAGHIITPIANGGVAVVATAYYDGDAATDPNPEEEIRLYGGAKRYPEHTAQLLIIDGDGHLVDAQDIYNLYVDGWNEYKAKYNLSANYNPMDSGHWVYHDEIRSYDNGDLLLFMYPGNALKMAINPTTGRYETVWFTPLGVNGTSISNNWYGNGDGRPDIVPTADGGFYAKPQYDQLDLNSTYSYYYPDDTLNAENLQINIDKEPYSEGELYPKYIYDPILKFEERTMDDGSKQAYLTNLTIWAQTTRNKDDVYVYGNTNLLKRFFSSVSGLAAVRTSDGGYILGFVPGIWSSEDFARSVELASGETVVIKPNAFALFKVNIDGGIEWLKQYDGITHFSTNPHAKITEDGKRILIPVRANGNVTEYGNPDFSISSNRMNLLIFDISDEIQPSGPEAYTLDIENKRKEYKVTATSNIGGEIIVTNPDNGQNVITAGAGTETLEKVKYGDTNKYDITIVPSTDYVVGSVQVNGEDMPYTVNADGSVTLDKITDIKEDKNISIIYDKNKSQVIVKHYLKDTTTSVFGDEILVGDEGSNYKTEPKVSNLYSLTRDDNGEYVLPTNMNGTYDAPSSPITVIYYYVENEVDLKTNYYIDGTEIELAPSRVQRKVLGSPYQTAPLDIDDYEVSRTIGEPQGTLNRGLTEVTFMYQQNQNSGSNPTPTDSTITIRYVDRATNQDIIPKVTKTVTKGSNYTTDDPVTIPAKYRQVGTPANASGPANDDEIEVIYYFEEIPFNVSVDKKINSVLLNGEKQTITNTKNVVITPAKKDNLIVYYEINLKNTGDIKANFTVVEGDVPGFVIYDKGNFTETNNGYELTAELAPGEEKTYRIGYKWNQKDYGISTNKVELKEVTNDKGFDEPDTLDNISTATVETKIPKDVLDENVIIPNTIDKIPTMIMLLIASAISIIVSIILIRKRTMN